MASPSASLNSVAAFMTADERGIRPHPRAMPARLRSSSALRLQCCALSPWLGVFRLSAPANVEHRAKVSDVIGKAQATGSETLLLEEEE
jgi:hypothetical protein